MMTQEKILPGCRAEAVEIEALIGKAVTFTHWSRPTLCHRVTGERDLEQRMRDGRITLRRMSTAKRALEKFIADKEKAA